MGLIKMKNYLINLVNKLQIIQKEKNRAFNHAQ